MKSGIVGCVPCAFFVTAVLVAAVGPPVPADVGEGDYVELDGVDYQRKGEALYTLDDPHLDDARSITITGSRLDRDRHKKLVRAEVIDGDAIGETGARTLADVLEEQGGVQINSSVGLGSEVFMDGLDGRHVLILVDGRPVNGKVNNRVDVSRLPVSAASIERIEIVRGPMSALYGSDALGGVINIITKKAAPGANGVVDLGGEVDVGGQLLPGGGGPWSSMGAHGHGAFGPGALRLDLLAQSMPGYDRGGIVSGDTTPDGKNDVPDRRNTSLSGDFSVTPFAGWTLRSTLTATTADTSATVAGGAPFRDMAENREIAWSTTSTNTIDAGLAAPVTLTSDLRIDRYTHLFSKQPKGDALDIPAFCDGVFEPACAAEKQVRTEAVKDEARLEVRSDLVFVDDAETKTPWGRELSLSTGAVLLREQASRKNDDGEDTLVGGGERATASVYGELLWRPLQWLSLLPGARLDAFLIDGVGATGTSNDNSGLALGPKLAARVELPVGFSVRTAVGRGFRLPSFEERFLRFDHSELGYIVEGNALLRPESSTGVRGEVGFVDDDLVFGVPVDLGVELSANFLENLITEQALGTSVKGIPVFTYGNASRALTTALTTRAKLGRWPAALGSVHVALGLDATWQYLLNAIDVSGCPDDAVFGCGANDGARSLPLRPAHAVDITARAVLMATDTTVFFRADVMSERPLVNDVAPGSVVLAAGIRQPVSFGDGDHAEVVVGLENLLDQTNAQYGPRPGRHMTINLRVWR